MKTKLTPLEVSFYQNSSMLAKQIKHIFTLISCREQSVLNNLDRIKHTELLNIIHVSYGYGSTRRFNEDENKTIEINDTFFITLNKELSKFIMNETTISQEIMNEIWVTLLMSVEYYKDEEHSKILAYSRLNKQYQKLIKYNNRNYNPPKGCSEREKKEHQEIQNKLSQNEFLETKVILTDFFEVYDYYMELCRNPHPFILNPYGFDNHFNILKETIGPNKDILIKANLYLDLEKFLELLTSFIITRNLLKYSINDYEKYQFLDNQIENKLMQFILVNKPAITYKKKTLKFHSIYKPFYQKKSEYVLQVENTVSLEKVLWDIDSNSFEEDPSIILAIYILGEKYFIKIGDNDICIYNPKIKNKDGKNPKKSYVVEYLLDLNINHNYSIKKEILVSYNGINTIESYYSNQYLFFKNDNAYLKINYVMDFSETKYTILSIQFNKNEVILERKIKNCEWKRRFDYKNFFSFENIEKKIELTKNKERKKIIDIKDLFSPDKDDDDNCNDYIFIK